MFSMYCCLLLLGLLPKYVESWENAMTFRIGTEGGSLGQAKSLPFNAIHKTIQWCFVSRAGTSPSATTEGQTGIEFVFGSMVSEGTTATSRMKTGRIPSLSQFSW